MWGFQTSQGAVNWIDNIWENKAIQDRSPSPSLLCRFEATSSTSLCLRLEKVKLSELNLPFWHVESSLIHNLCVVFFVDANYAVFV